MKKSILVYQKNRCIRLRLSFFALVSSALFSIGAFSVVKFRNFVKGNVFRNPEAVRALNIMPMLLEKFPSAQKFLSHDTQKFLVFQKLTAFAMELF